MQRGTMTDICVPQHAGRRRLPPPPNASTRFQPPRPRVHPFGDQKPLDRIRGHFTLPDATVGDQRPEEDGHRDAGIFAGDAEDQSALVVGERLSVAPV